MFRFPDIFNLGDPDSNSIRTPKGVTQDYNALRQQCLTSGRLFEDSIFAPRSSRNCEWLRPHEISSSPQFIASGISRFDVVQGELGDCWLVAAVANLTLNPKLFHLVVPPEQTFDRGSYCGIFKFRFWQFGKWVEVVIDDRLPTRNGQLLFMKSSDPNEFWSPLFEKAYAKLHGSYDALRGGTTCEAMVDLTGGLTEFFDVQTNDTPANLFGIIRKAFERGSLIGCSIEAQDESQRENELPNGLVKGHAYSVTFVSEVDVGGRTLPMLRLRNPWSGTSEWNGPWSDRSREWSRLSDYEKQKIGLCFEHDGEFWMAFSDWKQNFTRVELCNLTPDAVDSDVQRQWHAQLFEGSWIRGSTAGGCRNNLNTFAMNPQYLVSLVDPDEDDNEDNCTMIVALMQKNRRQAKKYQMGSSELTIGFAIYALRDGVVGADPVGSSSPQFSRQLLSTEFFKYNCSIARSPTFINLREITARFMLPPGTYAIIPSTYDKGEEGEFIVRVWTETPVKAGPAPDVYPTIRPTVPVVPTPPRPSPRPSPRPADDPAVPSYPPMPRFPTPTPGEPDKRPAYPPYPTPDQPKMPGGAVYPPYPSNPGAGPFYPTYPMPGGGGDDVRYPTLPDEPSIIRRRVVPPPPGPSIDISIGEVIGTVSTIISILTMCWTTYKSLTNQGTHQTYPYGGQQFAAQSGGRGEQTFLQSPGYSVYSANPNKRSDDNQNQTKRAAPQTSRL